MHLDLFPGLQVDRLLADRDPYNAVPAVSCCL